MLLTSRNSLCRDEGVAIEGELAAIGGGPGPAEVAPGPASVLSTRLRLFQDDFVHNFK